MTTPARNRTTVGIAAAALTMTALAGCGDDAMTARDTAAVDSSTRTSQPSAPTEPAESAGGSAGSTGESAGGSSEPSPEGSSTSSGETVTVPLYFAGTTPQGVRLFREFRAVPADNPLQQAAAMITRGDTRDRDYRTLFPSGSFADVTLDEANDVFVAELTDDGWTTRPSGMSRSEAKLAVQQLVYTLQGVAQTRAPVTFTLGGEAAPVFGLDSGDGIANADQIDVLALVNVTSPEEGATVGGSFTATGVASSFEATVPWEIRKGDRVVLDGFSTAEGWMDKLYPFTTDPIDVSGLAPGEYTFAAMTDDPSGGEGAGPTEDTKTITVE